VLAPSVAPERLILEPPARAVMVPPPQTPARPSGVLTTKPVGRASVNATPASGVPVFGLATVKLSEVDPLRGIVAALKALVIVGTAATLRFAVAAFPVPPFVDVAEAVTFVKLPATLPVTDTLNWHWLAVLMVAPDNTIPVGAVVVSVPPQTVAEAFATVIPVGSVSENATPVRAAVLAAGLVTVNVRAVVAFNAMPAGLKILAIAGGATTVRLAEAAPPVPPSVEVTLPLRLFLVPALVLVTLMEKVKELLAATVTPVRVIALVA
jgi:hypothetical protein